LDPRLRYFICAVVTGASFGVGLAVFSPAPQQVPGREPHPSSQQTSQSVTSQSVLGPIAQPVLGPIMAQGTDIVPIEVPPAGKLPADVPTPQSQLATMAPPEQLPAAQQKPDEAIPTARETTAQTAVEPMGTAAPATEPKATERKPIPRRRLSKTEPAKTELARSEPTNKSESEGPKAEPRAPKRSMAERAASKDKAMAPGPHKLARREPARKRLPSEALRTVRKFDDRLQDIPVSAYAADGSRREIVIRPTSIQDVYYYSVPR
jgi:hypothetical protein